MMHLSGPRSKGNKTPTPFLNAGKFSRVAHLFWREGVKALSDYSSLRGWAIPPSKAFRMPGLTRSPTWADLVPPALEDTHLPLPSQYPSLLKVRKHQR